MEFLLIVSLWAGLTLCFLRRFQVILINLSQMIVWRKAAMGMITYPTISSSRPAKQTLIWFAELWLVTMFYEVFGISILAHVTAAICGAGVMIALRERDADNFLESIQLVPMSSEQFQGEALAA